MQDGTAGFFRHRALVLVAAGGAVAEAGLLTLVAPAARAVAPQVTALPALSAYHDLRWLFADGQSWPVFALVVVAVLVARSGLDALLFRLAWPVQRPGHGISEAGQGTGLESVTGQLARPRSGRVFWSCLALTLLAWVLLSPVATLAFGVAVMPFSWPFIAALPIMIGMLLALSHGGILTSWWRRLPPPRAVGWMLASFAVLSAAATVTARLNTGPLDTMEALGVAAAAGLVNARAWYGLAGAAARLHPREHVSVPARVLLSFPYAPLAAVMVLALVIGVARLMFTGTIKFSVPTSAPVSAARDPLTVTAGTGASGARLSGTGAAAGSGAAGTEGADHAVANAVLVVAGWGSSCCNAGNGLGSVMPGTTVRQFSYVGLRRDGQPLPSGPEADDIPLPVLGDRMAAQVAALHAATRRPVDIVAESEGTLGVYAMLDRHPDLPLGSVVLLSPIIQPGQVGGTSGGILSVPEYALDELNVLVGSMSPYGPGGAARLLTSAGEFGADYFDHMVSSAGTDIRWLAVVPLADALTLSTCGLPASPDVVVVPAFHGGLLGDADVLPMVARFLGGRPAAAPVPQQDSLRTEAELISGAAAAWRMPQTSPVCP